MPLNQAQIEILTRAIEDYSFPAVYFDFNRDIPDDRGSMAETSARTMIGQKTACQVKRGAVELPTKKGIKMDSVLRQVAINLF
jgi:hypothetical protein